MKKTNTVPKAATSSKKAAPAKSAAVKKATPRRTAKKPAVSTAVAQVPARAVMQAPRILSMTQAPTYALSSWLLLIGVGVFATGMATGLLNTASLVGSEVTYQAPVHHEGGRVAGATVNASGVVTIKIVNGTAQQTYLLGIDGPYSVYNVLRLANTSTILQADLTTDAQGHGVVNAVDGVAAGKSTWKASVDGQLVSSFDDVAVQPGSTLTLTLAK